MFCPNCKSVSIFAEGIHDLEGINVPLYPNSQAKRYPDFVPLAIRKDYEEAYAILNLSPKASATLSRRCLQGMIRDFWNIKAGKLFDEINEIQDKVASSQWKAIDALRSIGNIGAHMEKDVNEIIEAAILSNKQVIFTGAPGTGKTFSVRKYVEGEDYKFVQFHPSYDYSDFVEGLRPVVIDGQEDPTFVRMDGIFKEFFVNNMIL